MESKTLQADASLRIFVLSHKRELLEQVPAFEEFMPIDLTVLRLGPLQTNLLGETRAFFCNFNLYTAGYMGFANARWNAKYHLLNTKLEDLPDTTRSLISPTTVLAPWPTNVGWLDHGHDWYGPTIQFHPTMGPLLEELATHMQWSVSPQRVSLWANDFICHRDVFFDWHVAWHKCFEYFYLKYGFALPFSPENTDCSRQPAYFYERFTTMFFANRPDLEVIGLP